MFDKKYPPGYRKKINGQKFHEESIVCKKSY